MESPKINPHLNSQIICNKNIQWGSSLWGSGLRIERCHCAAQGVAMAHIQALAWEHPCAMGVVKKQKKEKKKIASSINGGGKAGQLHAKESSWTTFSYHMQK